MTTATKEPQDGLLSRAERLRHRSAQRRGAQRGRLRDLLLATCNAATGALALDERCRAAGSPEVGIRMEGITWPHGGSGAVFSRSR